MALRAMRKMNTDLGFLMEAKLTGGICTRFCEGYHVEATEATSRNQGGIAMCHRDSPYFQVESVVQHGANVMSMELVTGQRRIPIVGVCMPPADTSTLPFIQQAMDRFPGDSTPILLGDLNVNLATPTTAREIEIATLMASLGLDDMQAHFRQRGNSSWTWAQQRQEEQYASRNDYILGTNRRQFTKVAVRTPRDFTSDHRMMVGIFQSRTRYQFDRIGSGGAEFGGCAAANFSSANANTDTTANNVTGAIEEFVRSSFRDASFVSPETALIKARPEIFVSHRRRQNSTSTDAAAGAADNDNDKSSLLPPSPSSSPSSLGPYENAGVFFMRNAFLRGEYPHVFDCSSVFVNRCCRMRRAKKQGFDVEKVAAELSSSSSSSSVQLLLSGGGSSSHGSRSSIVVVDSAVLIYQYHGNEYYHAMAENLPKLAYLVPYLRENPNVEILAGERYLQRRQDELNKLLGINNTWRIYDDKVTYLVKELLVPTGTECGSLDPTAAAIFQDIVHSELERNEGRTGRKEEESSSPQTTSEKIKDNEKLVLLLQKRTRRRILNHDELEGALRTRFADSCQVRLFHGNETLTEAALMHYDADLVVGPHGAGLTNAMFCRRPPQSVVGLVEFHPTYSQFSGPMPNRCHQNTAKTAGLLSTLVVEQDGSRFSDFTVNLTRAVDVVWDMIQQVQRERSHLGIGGFAEYTVQ